MSSFQSLTQISRLSQLVRAKPSGSSAIKQAVNELLL